MSVTAPPLVGTLPTPPATTNPTGFDAAADAFLSGLPAYGTTIDAVAANVYANATDTFANATLANTKATEASVSAATSTAAASTAATGAGGLLWSTGTYVVGNVRVSPITFRSYRCKVGVTGAVDPSNDGTNWAVVDTVIPHVVVSTTTQTAVSGTHYVLTNGSASTLTLPASPAAGDSVWITAANGLVANVIARGGQTIMGIAQDMTIDLLNQTTRLRFINNDWKLV